MKKLAVFSGIALVVFVAPTLFLLNRTEKIQLVNEHPRFIFQFNDISYSELQKENNVVIDILDTFKTSEIYVLSGPRDESSGIHHGTILADGSLYKYSGFNHYVDASNNSVLLYLYLDENSQDEFGWQDSVVELEINSRLVEALASVSQPGLSDTERSELVKPILYRMQEYNAYLLTLK